MIEVVQAFDRAPIAPLDSDDRAAVDRKIVHQVVPAMLRRADCRMVGA